MKKGKPFNLEERKLIEKAIAEGFSLARISRDVLKGRSKNGILIEVRKNGGISGYTAEKAQERAAIMQEQKYKNISELHKIKFKSICDVKQRLENLEMQIEILIETVKELKKG